LGALKLKIEEKKNSMERKMKLNDYNEDGVVPREYRAKSYKITRFNKA